MRDHRNACVESKDWVSPDEAAQLRAENARLREALEQIAKAGVDLEGAIHSEPTMSGHLTNLHISTIRGAEPLRAFKVALSDIGDVFELYRGAAL
jgi:hypothetical protein